MRTLYHLTRFTHIPRASLLTPHPGTAPSRANGRDRPGCNQSVIITRVTILAFSEMDLFPQLFDKFFPVVGPEFRLGPLGIFQCLIGGTRISHYAASLSSSLVSPSSPSDPSISLSASSWASRPNDPFRRDVGVRFPGFPAIVYSQGTCSDVVLFGPWSSAGPQWLVGSLVWNVHASISVRSSGTFCSTAWYSRFP